MKPIFCVIAFGISTCAFTSLTHAVDPAVPQASEQLNQICPISGKPANPKITVIYEGVAYAFADEASLTKFNEARAKSIYHRLGGKAAIDAAVESFYVKVLADDRIKDFFENINMGKQRRKQKQFLSAAFGGPIPWTGKNMREAHTDLELTDVHFNAVAENLQKTLEELNVSKELIGEVMAIAGSVRNDVLNRKAGAN